MGKADGLSQRPDWQKRIENDNEDQILMKPGWIKRTEILIEEGNLRKRIQKIQEGNERVVKAVEELKKARMRMLRDKEQTIEKGVVIKEK